MAVTYCILVLGYTCVNIPYGTLCGAMTQNMTERAQINTSRSVSAMIAIGIINIITIPLIEWLGNGNARQGYLLIAILYGTIFAVCHIFCFAKTKEVVEVPVAQKIPLRLQLQAVAKNKPYLLALLGQVLFGFILYGRNADLLYYFTYVENDAVLFTYYSMAIIIPSIIGAACFPKVFQLTSNKGWAASVFAFGTGITIIALFFFSPVTSPIPFYLFAALSQFFFSGFNTAIYAIIPDCVEYGEWRTGIRNDGFQYAFISLGNKIGMALGTALLALSLGWAGYEANTTQNEAVVAIMRHSFSTIPGILWVVTALALFFYKLDKRSYNRILAVIKYRFLKRKKNQREYDVIALGELLVDFNALHSNDFDSVVYESNPGGAPCNVLAMLSNLQKRTAFIGKVGDDFLGHSGGMLAAFISGTVSGVLAGIAGLVASSRIYSADANNIGLNLEMDAILAVALGGNILSGGKFSLMGSVIGAYTIQALTTTLYAMSVPSDQLPVYKAIVVIIIVVLQSPVYKKAMQNYKAKRQSKKAVVQGGEQ